MSEKLKVIVTKPIIRRSDGVLLKVSGKAFKDDPHRIYTLPRTPFWMQLIKDGAIKEVNEVVRAKPGPQPKPKPEQGE
jgi:hypothetical protein